MNEGKNERKSKENEKEKMFKAEKNASGNMRCHTLIQSMNKNSLNYNVHHSF